MNPVPRSARWVLECGDSYSSHLLGGLAYADQTADLADDPSASAAIRFSPKNGEIEVRDPEVGVSTAKVLVAAIDRRDLKVEPRPDPAPTGVAGVLVQGPDLGVAEAVEKYRRAAGEECDLLSLGSVGHGIPFRSEWPDLVKAASSYRLVHLARKAFPNEVVMAKAIIALCASGAPVALVEGDPDPRWVHPDLAALLRPRVSVIHADELEWAALVARQRRMAWLRHDLRILWSDGPRLVADRYPSMSILLASNRPHLLPAAFAQIAAQLEADPEVIVMLHGQDGTVAEVEASMNEAGLRGEVVAAASEVPLGAVLNMAAERSSGQLVVKWDDDDLYGPWHLLDLVVARRSSHADLVGKMAEFIHFTATNETIYRHEFGVEGESTKLAGGTLCLPRLVLDEVGGFPLLGRAVDHHLKARIRALGLTAYRTHGFGFVLVRTDSPHTWQIDDEVLRAAGARTWKGLPPLLDLGSGVL